MCLLAAKMTHLLFQKSFNFSRLIVCFHSFLLNSIFQVAHGVAGFFMFREERAAKERRDRNMALVMQMYPTPGLFDGSISNYHGSQFI